MSTLPMLPSGPSCGKSWKRGKTVLTCPMTWLEYGFEPKKLIDLKALMGDSSDNIPGVAGVGPKTAKELLSKFGSLDGVYEHLADASIRPKLREKLEAGKDSAYLSYDLATIRPEAPISPSCGKSWKRGRTALTCPMTWLPSARKRPFPLRPGMPLSSLITGRSCTTCSRNWNLSG